MDHVQILHLIEALFPVIGDLAVAEHRAEDARRIRGIAVRVVSTACADVDGCPIVTLPIQQTDHDIGGIDLCIDIKWPEHPIRAPLVVCPIPLGIKPGRLPVIGILFITQNHTLNALVKLTLGRNRLQGFPHYKLHIVVNEGQGIHGSHIHTPIHPIAVIHDVPQPPCHVRCGIDHPRSHQSGEIGLYLKIDVIGMWVIFPETRFRGHDPVQDVVACGLVSVPERISRACKSQGMKRVGRIEAMLFEHIHEGQVHVHIIV